VRNEEAFKHHMDEAKAIVAKAEKVKRQVTAV
jgi:hypothetical protein